MTIDVGSRGTLGVLLLALGASALVACSGEAPGTSNEVEPVQESAVASSVGFWGAAVDPSTDRLFVVTDRFLLSSDDDGQTFRERPIAPELHGVPFASEGRLYLSGSKLSRVTDDGYTITPVRLDYSPYSLAVYGDTLLVASANEYGDLLRSTDGGETFEPVPIPTGDRTMRTNRLCGSAGAFLADFGGNGVRRAFVTVDHGRTFRSLEGLDALRECATTSTEAWILAGTSRMRLYRLNLLDPTAQPQLVNTGDSTLSNVAVRSDGRFVALYATDWTQKAWGALVSSDGFATSSFHAAPVKFAYPYPFGGRAWVTGTGFGIWHKGGPSGDAVYAGTEAEPALRSVFGG